MKMLWLTIVRSAEVSAYLEVCAYLSMPFRKTHGIFPFNVGMDGRSAVYLGGIYNAPLDHKEQLRDVLSREK